MPFYNPDDTSEIRGALAGRPAFPVIEQEKCSTCGHESGAHFLNASGRPRCARRISPFGNVKDGAICRCTKPNLHWKLERATVPASGSTCSGSSEKEHSVPRKG